MVSDEQAIRAVIAEWMRASAENDLPRVLDLMAEDVVFLLPGRPPMEGRSAFAETSKAGAGQYRLEGHSDVKEIRVSGDLAYAWTELHVTVTPLDGGEPVCRSGPTLSIFRKEPSGEWVLFRDANMLTVEPPKSG